MKMPGTETGPEKIKIINKPHQQHEACSKEKSETNTLGFTPKEKQEWQNEMPKGKRDCHQLPATGYTIHIIRNFFLEVRAPNKQELGKVQVSPEDYEAQEKTTKIPQIIPGKILLKITTLINQDHRDDVENHGCQNTAKSK